MRELESMTSKQEAAIRVIQSLTSGASRTAANMGWRHAPNNVVPILYDLVPAIRALVKAHRACEEKDGQYWHTLGKFNTALQEIEDILKGIR